jgi:hypothetical protein
VNNRELATVLAALRYWQNDLDDEGITEGFADYFIEHTRLTAEEIDNLCEQLNGNECHDELVTALDAFDFSFDDVREKEGYSAALKRFCAAKRLACAALSKAQGVST